MNILSPTVKKGLSYTDRDDSVRPGLPLEGQIADTLVQLRVAHHSLSVQVGVMDDLIGHLTQQLQRMRHDH